MGIPLHLWSQKGCKEIYFCGGWKATKEETNLQTTSSRSIEAMGDGSVAPNETVMEK